MPGHARRDIVHEGEVAVYHTWSRCVQSTFLCGEDPHTGRNFEHRRTWIQRLLEYQASVFAVDIGNYSILANHQHLIARTRPDLAAAWTDEQVAWRWKLAWPSWQDGQWVREPTDKEIEELLADRARIPNLRANLSSLSWFMARWKEPIARLANAETQTKGHFYEQRFGSRELLDEGAVLSCSVYVDLNQIKAGRVRSLEECTCSGIHDRLRAWRRQEAEASVEKFLAGAPAGYALETSQLEVLLADCFLAPINEHGPLILWAGWESSRPTEVTSSIPASNESPTPAETDPTEHLEDEKLKVKEFEDKKSEYEKRAISASGSDSENTPATPTDSENAADTAGPESASGQSASGQFGGRADATWQIHVRLQSGRRRRVSDNVFLPMPLDQYLQIVRWTAQQLPSGTTHPPPPELEAVLRRWSVEPSHWRDLVEHFGDWFHHAVGRVASLARQLERVGQRWIQGIRYCRDVFS